jgi:trimeric autotransporter adhesin
VQKAPVASVIVTPPHVDVAPNGQAQFTAIAYDAAQNALSDRVIAWSTSNASVATVDAGGLMIAVGQGSATITATSEGKTGIATVNVGQGAVATVTITPSPLSMSVGQATQLAATLKDASGNVVTGPAVAWSSSNTAVATVSAQGLVTAVAAGSATITATSEGKSGSAELTISNVAVGSVSILPQGSSIVAKSTLPLSAKVLDVNGTVVTDRVVTWSTSAPTVATVSPTGLVTGVTPGTVVITANSEGKSGTTLVTVTPVPVGSVVLSPSTPGIRVTATLTLTPTVKDTGGVIVTDRVITWTSSSAAVATVTSAGVVTGVAPGTATITATSEGKSGTATVTVTKIPVGTVAVSPPTKSMLVTQTFALTPTIKDSVGSVVTDRVVTWGSSNTAVATVSTTGVVTAVGPGTADITATSETKSGTSTITVSLVPVSSVAVQPSPATITLTATAQLAAVTKDSIGGVLTGRVVTWSSSDATTVSVSSSGVITALKIGSATITATSEGKSGTSLVTVTKIPVASVTVAPPTKAMLVTQNFALTPTVKDSVGNVVTDRPVSWSSNNIPVATVSAAGVVTAAAPGTAIITATSETKSGTSTITVSPVPVGIVVVQPGHDSLTIGTSRQFAAVTEDSIGGVLTGRVVTWGSSDPTTASVSPTGLVTALKLGTATITATSEGKNGTSTVLVAKVPVGSVTLAPPSKALLVTQTVALSPTVKDSLGTVVTDRLVTWGSSNTAVATVSSAGVVTAVAPGTATITATSETKSGTSTITVSLVPVSTVAVSPPSAGVRVTATTQLAATTKDSIGGLLTGRVVTWGSSDPTVATVSSTGLVTGVAVGTATITATSEGKSGTSAITVTKIPVGSVTVAPPDKALLVTQTFGLAATVRDTVGTVVTDRVVTWGSSNTAVATVSSAGVVTAVAPGTATITATSETKSGTSTITVSPVPVSTVVVSPASAGVRITGTAQLTAVTKDSAGGVLTGRVVTWGSSDQTIATVNANGLVTGVALGSATITASSEGKSGTSTIAVTKIPVGSVTVAPPSKALLVTQTAALVATVADSVGTVVTDRVVTWGSNNTLVATVSSTGLVTAVAPGTATITATSETKSGTSTITVSLVPVSTVAVTPPSAGIRVTATTQLAATTKDSIGGVLTGRVVTWGSSDPTVATVSSTGLVTGAAAGTATITATSEGKSGTSTITVTKIPVGSVTVAPPTKAMLVTQSFALAATVADTAGNVVTDRLVTWGSNNTAVATVSAAGVVTAVAPGTATITATSETKSGTSTVTVSLVPVSTVAVTPASGGVRITGTTQLTAVTKDSAGGVLTGRAVTWGSSDQTIATVNASGLVTGVALGSATITATSEGKSGTSTITVTKIPVGTVTVAPPSKALLVTLTVSLAATVKDSVGTIVTDRVVTWGSNNTLVATVSATGLVTAVAPGTATITATSETKSGTSTITVSLVPVSTVVVQPAQDTLTVNATAQLTAATLDSIGGVLTGRVVTWASSDPTTASVSASGLVTALKPGGVTITATSEGKSGTSAVIVLQVPVASVTVLPPSPDTVFIGYTTQLSAVTKDAGGGTLTGRVVTWQSDNTAAATVDATGLVTGVAAGTANITATSEGKTGSVTLVSAVAPVGSVVVAPASDSVTTGGITKQLTATVRDVKGTVVTDRAITWASTQPSLASVSPSSGATVTVTGISPGSPSIVATAETKSGSSAVKVIPSVATVQIAPPTATLSVATTPTVQLSATLLDASSTVIAGRTITWASSDPTIATVNAATGLVTAKAPGTASITATAVLDGVTSSVATVITVVP